MAEVGHRGLGADTIEDYAAPPPAPPVTEPQGVLLGSGGDPLMLGLPIFIVGSLALGFALVGVVSSAGLGTIIPVIAAATAVGLFVSTFWAIFLGQSIVACIVGLFCGYWASLSLFLLGLFHGWFAIPAADVAHAQELFFISWSIVFFLLLIVSLRLPAVYPGIIAFVVLALILVTLGVESPGSASTFNHLAGICVFIFAGLGAVAFMNVGSIAMGGPASPPLGPPLVK